MGHRFSLYFLITLLSFFGICAEPTHAKDFFLYKNFWGPQIIRALSLPFYASPSCSLLRHGQYCGNIRQHRFYDWHGLPLLDIDWGHDHGQGSPHVHFWINSHGESPKLERLPAQRVMPLDVLAALQHYSEEIEVSLTEQVLKLLDEAQSMRAWQQSVEPEAYAEIARTHHQNPKKKGLCRSAKPGY